MHPVTFSIGNLYFYSFSLSILIGLILSVAYMVFLSKKEKINFNFFGHLILILFIVGIMGGRLFHVIFSRNKYVDNIFRLFYFWDGGLSMWGTILSVFLMFHFLCSVKKEHLAKWLDITSTSFLLLLSAGFYGQYAKGEGFGETTDFFLGVIYDNINSPYFAVKVHPTSLYLSIGLLILFLLIQILFLSKKRLFFGFIFYTNTIVFCTLHIITESLRQDVSYWFYGYNAEKSISVIVLIISLLYLFITSWRLYENEIKTVYKKLFINDRRNHR